jgi:outer membrane immunogenic protein
MRKYIFAALLAGTVAAPAMAQTGAPFTGPRVEGIVGYDRAQVEDDGDDEDSNARDGVLYGVGVGYDFQAGNMVAGIEGEAAFSTVDDCETEGTETLCAKVGRDLYVGGRIGSQVASNTLLYAKAGYTNARLEAESTIGTVTASERVDLDGVRLGAGAEFALGPNSFAKAEYRYSNYEQGFEKHQVVAGFGFRF